MFNLRKTIDEHFPGWTKTHPKTMSAVSAVSLALIVGYFLYTTFYVQPLQDENSRLREENSKLEAQLIPFKTVALEKYGNLPEKQALAELAARVGQVELGLINLAQYQEVATWDAYGTIHTVMGGGTATATGPSSVTGWNEGYWELVNGHLQTIKCDAEGIQHYLDTIEKAPLYPFSQFSMLWCLREKEDDGWKTYFQKTFDIVSRTTAIPNHHQDHDWLMEKLTQVRPD